MDSNKKKALETAYERVINVGFCIVPYEDVSDIVDPNVMLFGTTKDEQIFSLNEFTEFIKSQYQQMESFEASAERNRLYTKISKDQNSAIITEEITLNLVSEEIVNSIYMRSSFVMHYTDDRWTLTHGHASTPVETENDHWHLEEWKREKEKLQKLVDEQTADLHSKNRELEIEAAIERVRARAMAMQESDELAEVSSLLFQQMKELGVNTYSSGFTIWDEDRDELISWMCNADGSMNPPFHMPMTENSWHKEQYDSWKNEEDLIVKDLIGEEMQSYFRYLRSFPLLNQAFRTSEDAGHPMPKRQVHHVANFSHGNLLFIALEPVPEVHYIFKRFAKVFEQTYTRFLDLQKAEAQTREAQINLAVESVRAKALAMFKSEEILQVVNTLKNEIMGLDIPNVSAATIHLREPDGKYRIWDLTSAEDDGTGIDISLDVCYRMEDTHPDFFMREVWSRTEDYFVVIQGLDRTIHTIDWLRKNGHADYANEFAAFLEESELEKAYHPTVPLQNGRMSVDLLDEPTPEIEIILKKMAGAFDLAYKRFEDLQTAEAQAKEAQIELSLERIRAQVTSMQESSDLLDIVVTMRTEFVNLGHEAHYFWHMRWLPETYKKAMTSGDGSRIGMVMTLPRHIHGDIQPVAEWEKSNERTYVLAMDVDEAVDYVDKMITLGDFEQLDPQAPTLDDIRHIGGLTFIMARTTHGEIGFSLPGVVPDPPKDAVDTLVRFAGVFDLAYKRFEDLKKAEAQARETKTELALERVRARSMAMHKSDELADLSLELVKQVHLLGIDTWFCAFNIYDDHPDGSLEWGSNGQGTFPEYRTPREGIFLDYYEAGQRGEKLLINEINEEECPTHYDYLCSLSGVGDQLLKMKNEGIPFPASQIDHVAFFKYGYIIFITFEPAPEAHDIFKRFSKVFEQTYTRFLDLQKAEAQAREAKIEASLEKLRSRTSGMQSSDELPKVANMLFLEIQALGIPSWSCGYCILEEDRHSSLCIMSSEGTLQKPFLLPHSGEPSFEKWDDFVHSDETFFTQELGDDAIDSHYTFMKSLSQLTPIFKEIEEAGLSLPTYQINHLCKFSYGFLLFITYEPVPDAHDIFKRFTKVFDQTYTRFLDLKKAEAQAREAKIEAALERVRARSMGMQKSGELIEVVRQIGKEVSEMDIEVQSSQIWTDFSTDPDDGLNIWVDVNGQSYLEKFHIPFVDQPITSEFYEALEKNLDFFSDRYSKSEKDQFFRFLFKNSDLKSIPQERKDLTLNAPGWIRFTVILNNSCLHFGRYNLNEFTEEEKGIFIRLGKAFGQAYTRFLDLQKAEEQAAEAIKQASLDRVRGEIASMRSTDDLQNITPLIWNELKTLDVSFIRCGVFIIHEDEHQVEVYLSKPDGNSLAVMHLPFGSNELVNQTVESWRNKEVYNQHWSREEFLDWGRSMMEQNQVPDLITYQGAEEAPESLHLHFIPFNQGMLYVGSTESLSEEEIGLAESLTEAFSIAYARYDDFVKLEKAKAGIEDALTELKATQSQLIQQEKLASLGQLTAGIAHEIKNPLNFVNNFSDLSVELVQETKDELSAISDQLSAEDRERVDEAFEILNDIEANLKKVHEHGSRADSIVKSMLEHSRGGTGNPEPTDLNSLVKEFVNLSFHGMRAAKNPINVDMEFELDDSIIEVPLVTEDFSRVIVNLCSNAFDAMREKMTINDRQLSDDSVGAIHELPLQNADYKPKLTIRTKSEGNVINLEIEDNGPGIPEEMKDKILQPFFTTKKGTEGTGLGLSITNDIIKAHGGSLDIQSQQGKTIFIIRLNG